MMEFSLMMMRGSRVLQNPQLLSSSLILKRRVSKAVVEKWKVSGTDGKGDGGR